MSINWKSVISDLETGLAFVQKIAPSASIAGPLAGKIGSVVSEVANLAQGYLTAATDTAAVIESSDLVQIRSLTAQIVGHNDDLSRQIASS